MEQARVSKEQPAAAAKVFAVSLDGVRVLVNGCYQNDVLIAAKTEQEAIEKFLKFNGIIKPVKDPVAKATTGNPDVK